MIYTELPKTNHRTPREYQKKHITIVPPDKVLANEKRLLAFVLLTFALIVIALTGKKV